MSKEKFCNSPEDYRRISRDLDRAWAQALPPNEFAMVRFIFDRTIGWAKEWEKIPITHFTEGIIGYDFHRTNYGGMWTCSKSTVIRLIRALVAKGAIRREIAGKSFQYSLNLDWEPLMKTPKRIKNAEKGAEGSKSDTLSGSKYDTSGGPKSGPKEEEENIIPTENRSKREAQRYELEEGTREAARQSASRRAHKKKEGHFCRGEDGGFVPSPTAMGKFWEDLHFEHCEGHDMAPLSNRALLMVRTYCLEWNQRHRGLEFTTDYLPWLFANWSTMRKTQLSWMLKCSEIPEPAFVSNAKMRPHFEEGWRKRSRIEHMATLSPRDREVLLLKDRGMSDEAAERMATELASGDLELAKIRKAQRKLDATTEARAPVVRRRIARPIKPSDTDRSSGLPEQLPSWDD